MKKITCLILILFFSTSSLTVFADDFVNEPIININEFDDIATSNNITSTPNINARHAIVIDRASETILYGKKENEQCKMASTTKIMTAIVVIENVKDLSQKVTISKKSAGTGGSRLGLSTNDTITVDNLLYGLMMCSGNDAAVALAEFVGNSVENFSDLMNQEATKLGLKNTHFVTPHGLDNEDHFTTAYDLAILTNYALKNETFSKIVRTKKYTVNINGNPKNLNNTNELLGNFDGIYGVKTGFTNGANRCLVTSCKRGNLDIICVVLGCDTKKDRTKDSMELINYTFNNFTMVDIESLIFNNFNTWRNNHINSFQINKGIHSNIDPQIESSTIPYSKIAINNSELNNITTPITYNTIFDAPLNKSSTIGTLELKVGNNSLFSVAIVNNVAINKKNFFDYWLYFFKYSLF